jgi:pimeloyl-ACP methyl ester carboxylesterase
MRDSSGEAFTLRSCRLTNTANFVRHWLDQGVTAEQLSASYDGVVLAGTLWRPRAAPRALVIMHPGSGESDRHNDVLFPPIRAALLDAGVAVCSFDKRGVGGSSGSWLDADIETQARDLVASLSLARGAVPQVPVGLFGHSQGGWVVLAAAASARPDFVITNSGPAVTPREQETYSTEQRLRGLGWNDAALRSGMDTFSKVVDALVQPFDAQWPTIRRLPLLTELVGAGVFIPDNAQLWSFAASILDYDPRPALRRLDAPLLALLGAADAVVPVQRSAAVFRETGPPALLDLRIVPGADHRFQSGGEFAAGYIETITGFVAAHFGLT